MGLQFLAVEGGRARREAWADGRGSLRTEVHGYGRSSQAGEFRSHNRRRMRSGSSCLPEEKQEVHSIVRWRIHAFDPSLQEAQGVCRVLGTGCFCAALKWSQTKEGSHTEWAEERGMSMRDSWAFPLLDESPTTWMWLVQPCFVALQLNL